MAQWRLQDPSNFPPQWHDAMRQGIGKDKVVQHTFTRQAVKAAQERFRLFRFCLRGYPLHPTARFEKALLHQTSTRFNRELKLWELVLTSKPSVFAELQNPEVLENNS